MTKAKQPRNRDRILPDERSKLDSAMVKRLKSWGEMPIRKTDRALVDVEFELGRVIKNASKRENWVFSSVAAERAAEVAIAFDLFSESADLTDLRHFVLRPRGQKPKADQLQDAIQQLSDDYDQYVGPLVSEGLVKPLLCTIHIRYDAALGVFDPHAHCVWRVATDDLDAVFKGIQTKFSTIWMDRKRIRNAAALVNYILTWIIDHRALQDWPKKAVLALWRLPRPRFRRQAGLFAEFKGTLKGHRLVRRDGAVNAVPVQKRPPARDKAGAAPLKTGSVVGYVRAKVLGKPRWCAIAVVNGKDPLSRQHIDDILAQSTLATRKASRGYPTTTTELTPFPADPPPSESPQPSDAAASPNPDPVIILPGLSQPPVPIAPPAAVVAKSGRWQEAKAFLRVSIRRLLKTLARFVPRSRPGSGKPQSP